MKFLTQIVLILSAGLTAGCKDLRPLLSECDWADPIRPSLNDRFTDATLGQIVAHNELGEQICGWEP